ncbi:SGNH/GDSL hydrolase family protein [Nocardioides panzhihuensis]|uniref:Lysophospholipase L1-like esterase n=1 Tax=Nocardioides panzhihuensis TaxID=860243 RepID=A0A7Z0ITH1_9ACTN|nr:SGNH/GDSL hydrolase family protein [Nocardioides panzhihuensis]NYI79144.1 lysophospholipase L1-like esterase [Nocardioides panzhihuensis]
MLRLPVRTAIALAAFTLATPQLSAAQAATPDEYAGLGDSYSAGNGAYSSNLDVGCGRNTYAYPYVVAQARPNTHLTFVACQSAVTDDVVSSQVNSLSADTDYVSITIGGNDVGFANLIFNCAGSFSFNCENAANDTKAKITNELPAKLDRAYAAIRAKAPSATVAVLGYPRLFGNDLSCAAADGITAQEAVWANEISDMLDTTTADRAAAAGFSYKSSIASFTKHDVCAVTPYVNGKSWSMADGYHPTRAGYSQAMAPAVRAVIG